MNETVKGFIEGFEKEFSPILAELTPVSSEAEYTRHFEVFKARKKYYDWDLRCRLRPEAMNTENLKRTDKFIRSFKDFSDVGVFLSFSEEHKGLVQHVDSATWLQFMTFMPKEKFGPFLDIHIEGVNKEVLSQVFKPAVSEELLKWAMINYWRKIKNGNEKDANGMLRGFILKSFREQRATIEANPISFIKSKLTKGGCKKPVEFLEGK